MASGDVVSSINLSGDDQTSLTADGMDVKEFQLRKRVPRRLPKEKNDVYVNTKTNFKAQLARCKKLLESGETEIYIHGLGRAIDRAINLALQLKMLGAGSLEVEANTDTIAVVDDLEPLRPGEGAPETQTRNTSSIHIRVYRIESVSLKTPR